LDTLIIFSNMLVNKTKVSVSIRDYKFHRYWEGRL